MQKPAFKKEIASTIFTTKDLWKSFETGDKYTPVLKNISLDIQAGEFVILFGPSGCGKSTFLNSLMGLEHPDKGNIQFMGMDVWNLNSDDRAVIRKNNIGIIYQQQNWIKALNVLENVALIGSLLGYGKEKSESLAMEKLQIVEMTHRAGYKPYELSSGEQQRINLARSLMSCPSIIIADEPTGSLDVKNGLKVMNILKDLAKGGKTILMVTHNPEYFPFADRVLFMLDGRIRKDVKVNKENVDELKRRINEDIEAFIDDAENGEKEEPIKAPNPILFEEELPKGKEKLLQLLGCLKFLVVFTFLMLLILVLYVPTYILEKLFFRKRNLSEKVSKILIKIFNKLEGKRKNLVDTINSWELGEISLRHLMENKSRTLITVLGMGVGIGFITFLLSLGYGLENLVIGEIAEIEERRQVSVNPVVGSDVVLDEERMNIISTTNGIENAYPLINVATTLFYEGSQTDVVAYGVESEYIVVTGQSFVKGENFDDSKKEIVVGRGVLEILNVSEQDIVGRKLGLEFIPTDKEKEVLSDGDTVGGVYDDRVEFMVVGIVANDSSPIIFFPIKEAMDLGITSYSEVLVELTEGVEMNPIRREIETLGMETSSVMDTVSEVETFFGYLRIGLAVLGTIAFLVAVLGMINTLTVSLMERTREVGLLKSIGMRSAEVRRLFITESMLIAFFGGVSGIFLGMFFGLILSLIISGFSITNGGDYLAVSKVPIILIIGIIFISVTIGFITGLYPSNRAVKMSPLDALRYE